MPAACIQCGAAAFVAPALHGTVSRRGVRLRLGPLSLRRRPLARRSPMRCLRMEVSPDDLPSDTPDPADKRLDMELLRQRMSDVDRKGRNGFRPTDAVIDLSAMSNNLAMEEVNEEDFLKHFDQLQSLWVIIFTNVSDGSDGVYSLTVAEESIVLAFQDREEAQRYALCLEAQQFPSPQVCELDSEELCNFCGESGFRLGFVPKGALISPPDESAIDDIDKWRGKPSPGNGSGGSTGLSEEDIEVMKKRLDSLFGQ